MQPITQTIPQASIYQIVPTIQSIPQIPMVRPSMPYVQVSFQGQALQGQPQIQFIQDQPVQGYPFQPL